MSRLKSLPRDLEKFHGNDGVIVATGERGQGSFGSRSCQATCISLAARVVVPFALKVSAG
jgi:hypothetical protein